MRPGLRFVFAMCCGALSQLATAAPAWEFLGPAGGTVTSIAAGAKLGTLYAGTVSTDTRTYSTVDDGVTWTETPAVTGCNYHTLLELKVRADGDVFARCYTRVLRSKDGMRTWTPFSPVGVDGAPALDPTSLKRAVIRSNTGVIYFTDDDGIHWTARPPENGMPDVLAFDPYRSGRLVGVSGQVQYLPTSIEYMTALYESLDFGVTWHSVASIIPPTAGGGNCAQGQLFFDTAGVLFYVSACGFFKSSDAGSTWRQVGNGLTGPYYRAAADPSNPSRLVAIVGPTIYESRDAGENWRALPAPPAGIRAFDVALNGDVWIATERGVFVMAASRSAWVGRNTGLYSAIIGRVETLLSGSQRLLTSGSQENVASIDDGASWQPFRIDNQVVAELFRNLTDPASMSAYTIDSRLFSTSDAGATWKLAAAASSPAYFDQTYAALVPVGTQPGLVYGLFQTCESGGFTGCFWGARDVVRSLDGGRTWTKTGSGVSGSVRIFASPADPQVLMVAGWQTLFRSRDGATRWEKLVPNITVGYRLQADPLDPARWYAIGDFGQVAVSSDYGTRWSSISPNYMLTRSVDLLIDPTNTSRLILVRTDGGISVSIDRGANWRTLVTPSPTLAITPDSARVSRSTASAIYAGSGQGVLKLDLATATGPAPTRAIEYYRPQFDHYFITADPTEIAALDSSSLGQLAFARSGESFEVLPAGTALSEGMSPACRFYGKPEKGLDSHFFSLSPTECQQVKDRFADSWVYESPNVFVAGLPSPADGACPTGMVPVYRVFNNRRDANHRYTTSIAVRDQMVAKGWTAEGYGPNGVAMCAR